MSTSEQGNGTLVVRGRNRLRFLTRQAAVPGLFGALLVIWAIFYLTTDGIFLTDRNLVNLLRQTSVTAIVSLGMLIVIAQGEIDLSVGSLLGLAATITALLERSNMTPFWATILIVIAVGVAAGIWNGIWVGVLGIPAFVATLGGLLAFRGISLVLSQGQTISGIGNQIAFMGQGYVNGLSLLILLAGGFAFALLPVVLIVRTPRERRAGAIRSSLAMVLFLSALSWATLSYRGLPMPVAIVLALAAIMAWTLTNTVAGRHVYAVGASRTASRVAGIRVRRHVIAGFVLVGVLTSVAALVVAGRLGSVPPDAGQFMELNAIAAVVIGGASLYGGTGKVTGVLLGALLTQSLLNGLSLMNVPTAYQYVTSGLVLILAVFLDAVSRRGGKLFVRI